MTTTGCACGESVTLEQVLECRDQRALRQRVALQEHGKPVLSLTLVMPGPVKESTDARFLFWTAINSIDAMLQEKCWPILAREVILMPTGPEALYVVNGNAHDLKCGLTELEDQHALGRLWDIDVIGPDNVAISRSMLGLASRRCLVCGAAAHACARSRAHPLEDLLKVIEEKVDGYRRSVER
ncbi:MAG: citrate lyase holo-[acyl-carrier protein] synthase [Formivibrio sp.]|nr:citrate lyase holo-[acyl-carrier protein] synthase [Formivibrio sp.]